MPVKMSVKREIAGWKKILKEAPSYKEGLRIQRRIAELEQKLKNPKRKKPTASFLSGGLPGLGKR